MADYSIVRGETLSLRATVDQNCSPINISSYTVYLTAKRSYYDDDTAAVFAINSVSNPSQFDMTSAASGIVDITILPSNTSSIDTKTSLHGELSVKDGSGNIVIKKQFELMVLPPVLRVFA